MAECRYISHIAGLTLSLNASAYSVAESDGFVRICVLGLQSIGNSISATATISTYDISARGLFIYFAECLSLIPAVHINSYLNCISHTPTHRCSWAFIFNYTVTKHPISSIQD